jgi:hypothetical protein
MIKTGDKVVCIKDAEYYLDEHNPDITEILYKYGEIYTIRVANFNDIFYINVKRNDKDSNTSFYLEEPIDEWNKFSDYFITLAEWRDKQINSILDE